MCSSTQPCDQATLLSAVLTANDSRKFKAGRASTKAGLHLRRARRQGQKTLRLAAAEWICAKKNILPTNRSSTKENRPSGI
mmetsp:Transcript_11330/g.13385  ORF Transcript_11330/g.13385 Transcript_11330/m.13385 type:complete len:81 (+) Transcript_11330:599-841(+)